MIKRHTAVGNGLVGGEGGLKHRELVCTNEGNILSNEYMVFISLSLSLTHTQRQAHCVKRSTD